MTSILGLKLEAALDMLAQAGETGYAVQMLDTPKQNRASGTARVVAVRERERVLIASRFMDMEANIDG